MHLPIQLRRRIESFISDHDLGFLYKEYYWAGDTWDKGFPKMRQLEKNLGKSATRGYLKKSDIISVAKWGGLRNIGGIRCDDSIAISLYDSDDWVDVPSAPLRLLREEIKGVGPTYLSKVLMFSRPQLYGAIDTRLVRIFGRGDTNNEELKWLSLKVTNYGYGWYIPENQTSWPSEYYTWIKILHHMAHLCNTYGHKCPHPDGYTAIGLREKGIWIVADIETALFSYASKRLKE